MSEHKSQHTDHPNWGIGKHPKYKTPDEMAVVIEAYFEFKKLHVLVPTMTGLACALGFRTRKSIMDYKNKSDGFEELIRDARMRVEEAVESELLNRVVGSVTGPLFNLKNNFGWVDKQDHEHTGAGGGPITWTVQTVKALEPKKEEDGINSDD